MFKTAKQIGQKWASQYVKENRQNHQFIDEIIFVGMQENPYKGKKSKDEFNEGVSEWVNMIGRIETRKSIYG